MSLPIGRVQCRKHPRFIGTHLPKADCYACDFLYFMRKSKRYFFDDDQSCVEVKKLVLRKRK